MAARAALTGRRPVADQRQPEGDHLPSGPKQKRGPTSEPGEIWLAQVGRKPWPVLALTRSRGHSRARAGDRRRNHDFDPLHCRRSQPRARAMWGSSAPRATQLRRHSADSLKSDASAHTSAPRIERDVTQRARAADHPRHPAANAPAPRLNPGPSSTQLANHSVAPTAGMSSSALSRAQSHVRGAREAPASSRVGGGEGVVGGDLQVPQREVVAGGDDHQRRRVVDAPHERHHAPS